MKNKPCLLTQKQISHYIKHLQEQECAAKTIQKYTRDLIALLKYLDGRQLTKGILIEWKGSLMEKYAPASVNSMLTAVNCFLSFTGRREMAVRLLKIQRSLICDESREPKVIFAHSNHMLHGYPCVGTAIHHSRSRPHRPCANFQ